MIIRQRNPEAHHALSASGKTLLADCLGHQPLLAFDFDGTLAPIVSNPGSAELSRKTGAILSQLTLRSPCVVVSGRARADVLDRLSQLPFAEVIGNHGSEPYVDLLPLKAQVARWLPLLNSRLGHIAGIVIEDKGCSLSIHYRGVAARHEALTTALDAVAQLGGARVAHGKCVLNVLPKGAMNKGMGVQRAMEQLGRTRAIYLGDDDTDEDVFRLPAAAGVLGVRVDYRSSSRAPLYLYGQAEVDELLKFILSMSR